MDQNAIALSGVAVALLGLAVTIGVALHQLNRQHRSTLAIQEAHLRHELQLEIFREISGQLQHVASATNIAISQARRIVLEIEDQIALRGEISQTAEGFFATHSEAARALSSVHAILERYEIVFYRFGSARRMLGDEMVRSFDFAAAVTRKAGLFLPSPDGPRPHPFRPTPEDAQLIADAANAYINIIGNLQGFVLDLQIEAQNCLLGGLFNRTLPPRNPLDPAVPVLKPDRDSPVTARPPGRII